MTNLDYAAVKEVIRLLPLYGKTLDFDIVLKAYQNVLATEIQHLYKEGTDEPVSQ